MMKIYVLPLFVTVHAIISLETYGLFPCDFDVTGARAIGENDILVPINFDIGVGNGINLSLDSGIVISERRDLCVIRTRPGDDTVIGCTGGYPKEIDYRVDGHKLVEYNRAWALNISNVQIHHSESKYTWKYRDTDDVIGETRVVVLDRDSRTFPVTAASGRNMSVVIELDAENAIDVGFETTDRLLFFFKNVQGFAQDCYISNEVSKIYPIQSHNFLSINYIHVCRRDVEGTYYLTVTPNADIDPHTTSITVLVEDKYVINEVVHQPACRGDTAILQCSTTYNIITSEWFLNDTNIQSDTRHSIANHGTSSTCIIHETSDVDSGAYHCRLEVHLGTIYGPKVNLTIPVAYQPEIDVVECYSGLYAVIVSLISSVTVIAIVLVLCWYRSKKQQKQHDAIKFQPVRRV